MRTNKIFCFFMAAFLNTPSFISFAHADDIIQFNDQKNTDQHTLSEGNHVWIHRLGEITIVEALLTSKKCKLKILESRESDLPSKIYKKNSNKDTSILINGGFFGYDSKGHHTPIGLVRSEGKRLNSLIPWSSGGVLVANESSIDIIPAWKAKSAGRWPEAIQSKPIIIANNKVDVRLNLRDAPYNRSSFGITTKNEIYIVGMFHSFGEAGTLLQFSNIVLEAAKARGIEIKYAIAMDGGPGAHIYIPTLDKNFGEGGKTYVPNMISITGCNQ